MATKQSAFFKGNARPNVNHAAKVGVGNTYLVSHVFTENVATTDVLELFPLPAGARVTSFDVVPENLPGVTMTVGVMSGVSGDADAVRTCGTELLAAATAATPAATPLLSLVNLAIDRTQVRSIGFIPGTSIVAGATKKLHFRITLVMP